MADGKWHFTLIGEVMGARQADISFEINGKK